MLTSEHMLERKLISTPPCLQSNETAQEIYGDGLASDNNGIGLMKERICLDYSNINTCIYVQSMPAVL